MVSTRLSADRAKPSCLLVVKLDHIGDFALALPALWAWKQAEPQTVIDVAVAPVNLGWREAAPWLGEFFAIQFPGYQAGRDRRISKGRLLLDLARLAMRLRGRNYQAAVDLRIVPGDWRGKLVAGLSGAPRRLGGPGAGRALLTEVCEEHSRHQADRLAERLRRLVPALVPVVDGCVAIRRTAPRSGAAQVLLHPGAGNTAKQWPTAYWIRLARMLAAAERLSFRFLGGRGDEGVIREIGSQAGLTATQRVISGSICETLELIANSDLLVGLDSAAPHLAALVGTPAITIFSAANDPERWRALGANTVLFTPIECSPCEQTTCRWPTHRCMEQITAQSVFAAIQEKLDLPRLSS